MVDALKEAHRVLRTDGVLIDLRPDRDPANRPTKRIAVEFLWHGRRAPAGVMCETPAYYPDYLAADRAVARILRQGLFSLERGEMFRLRAHFRDLMVLERYLASEWTGTTLPPETRQSLRALLRQRPGGWIVASDLFLLNILRKVEHRAPG